MIAVRIGQAGQHDAALRLAGFGVGQQGQSRSNAVRVLSCSGLRFSGLRLAAWV